MNEASPGLKNKTRPTHLSDTLSDTVGALFLGPPFQIRFGGTSSARRRGMRPVVLAFCLLAATACDEKGPTGPTVPLNQQFTLAAGEAAVIAGAALRVEFVRVTGDSRCPADALCIQGGDAVVRVSVSSGGTRRDYELHTGSLQPVRHDTFTITLVELAPYPFSSRTIAPGDYRATLRVTR